MFILGPLFFSIDYETEEAKSQKQTIAREQFANNDFGVLYSCVPG